MPAENGLPKGEVSRFPFMKHEATSMNRREANLSDSTPRGESQPSRPGTLRITRPSMRLCLAVAAAISIGLCCSTTAFASSYQHLCLQTVPPVETGFIANSRTATVPDQEDFDEAKELSLGGDGKASVDGRLRDGGKVDLYQFEAAATGTATVSLIADGSSLDTVLAIYDSSMRRIIENDDFGDLGSGSQASFRVVEGQKYYIQAGSYDDAGGAYKVNVEVAEGVDPLEDAIPLELDDDGNGNKDGRFTEAGQLVIYRVDSDFDGQMVISLAAAGDDVDTFLRVYDDEYRMVNFNDDGFAGNTNSQLTIRSEEGKSYFVEASAYDDSTGGYELTIEGMPGEDPLDGAVELEFDEDDKASQQAELTELGQNDYFRFVAPVDGKMTVIVAANDPNMLDTYASVFDDEFRIIDSNDDAFDANTNAAVTIMTRKGETYFARASAYSAATGAYNVQVVSGGIPSPFDDAVELQVNAAGRTAKRGELGGLQLDAYYTFESDSYSDVTMTLVKGMASDIDPYLSLFNSERVEIASNDDFGDSTDSQLTFRARPGQMFYVKASSVEQVAGTFLLTVKVTERPSPLEGAKPIDLDDEGNGEHEQESSVALAEDGFRFVAPIDGELTIMNVSLASGGLGSLDPVLEVFDANGESIEKNDDAFQFNSDAAITIEAEKGNTYFLIASSYGEGSGGYKIVIAPGGIPSPFDNAIALELDEEGRAEAEGRVELNGQGKYYAFEAPADEKVTIVQRSVDAGQIDTLLSLYNSNEIEIANNDDAFPDNTDSAISFSAEEGETYYIRAGAYEGSEGDFRLEVFVGELPSPFDDAVELTFKMGEFSLKQAAEIAESGESMHYKFVAPLSGRMVITQKAGAASSLDSNLMVYNSDREEIASNDDGFPDSLDSRVSVRVKEGDAYFVTASALDEGTGSFVLELIGEEVPDPFESAKEIELADGAGSVEGELKESGDPVVYLLKPTEDMVVVINLEATDGGDLDTLLTVFDADQESIAENDDASDFSTDSKLTIDVEAGKTYFVQAAAYNSAAGEFKLSITQDD